mgnify:CR=1 FL=1
MAIRTTHARESTITVVILTNTSNDGPHPKDQNTVVMQTAVIMIEKSIWSSQH